MSSSENWRDIFNKAWFREPLSRSLDMNWYYTAHYEYRRYTNKHSVDIGHRHGYEGSERSLAIMPHEPSTYLIELREAGHPLVTKVSACYCHPVDGILSGNQTLFFSGEL